MSERAEKLAKFIAKAESQIQEAERFLVDSNLVSEIAGRFKIMLDDKDVLLVSGTD